MIFNVKAFDLNGRRISETIKADNVEELFDYLSFCHMELISFKEESSPFIKTAKLTADDITEILENLHLVIKSGMSLTAGLAEITEDTEKPEVRKILNVISFRITSGDRLSKAMSSATDAFGETIISLIKIGEETGCLDETLKDAAEHVQRIAKLKAEIKQALLYPAFAFFSLLSALVFWLVYVMPEMAETFKVFDTELPLVTRLILVSGEFTKTFWLPIISIISLSVWLFFYIRKTNHNFRFKTDSILLRLPIFGKLIRLFCLAFFGEYIKLMISSGLPLFRALEVLENGFDNEVYKKAVKDIKQSISNGSSFSSAMSACGLFPPLFIRMVNIGEQTGHLTQQLAAASEHYFSKAERTSKNMSKVLEPLIIGFVGIFMLVIFIGLLSPVFSLISAIK